MTVGIVQACKDGNLFAPALGAPETWEAWHAVLKAAFGEELNRRERRLFAKVAGSRTPPQSAVSELWAICGRRSGKSRVAAIVATYIAVLLDHSDKLAPGEPGYVLALAVDRDQALRVFDYIKAFFDTSPMLGQLVAKTKSQELHLTNGVIIAVHTTSHRSVRGRTLLACVFDEAAYWRDETSATPDKEVYRAVLPALSTTGGMLVGISSPYRRTGLLFEKYRDHYGQDDDKILVVQGGTLDFNPTADPKVIERARANDPAAAQSEWDAEFRTDLQAFLDEDAIEAAVDRDRPAELPYQEGHHYIAFTDASAGRADAFTLCIVHRDDGRLVVDLLRARNVPFNPENVAAEFADTLKSYGVRRVVGDNYSGEWVKQAFEKNGITYQRASRPKSQIYLEALPLFMQGNVSMPEHKAALRELRLLERRTSRAGRDSVDHGPGGHDDLANSLCGALVEAATKKRKRKQLAAPAGERVPEMLGPMEFPGGFDGFS